MLPAAAYSQQPPQQAVVPGPPAQLQQPQPKQPQQQEAQAADSTLVAAP